MSESTTEAKSRGETATRTGSPDFLGLYDEKPDQDISPQQRGSFQWGVWETLNPKPQALNPVEGKDYFRRAG